MSDIDIKEVVKDYGFGTIAILLFVALFFASMRIEELAGPDDWLLEWTAFAGKYATVAVAVHKVWRLGDAAAARLNPKQG